MKTCHETRNLLLVPFGAVVAAGHASHAASGSDRFWTLLAAGVIVFFTGIGLGRKRGIKHASELQFKKTWDEVKKYKLF